MKGSTNLKPIQYMLVNLPETITDKAKDQNGISLMGSVTAADNLLNYSNLTIQTIILFKW